HVESAAGTYVTRTIGSLSFSSTDTHANGRCDCDAHSASSVVFPHPGPADTNTIGIESARSSTDRMSVPRGTVPSRRCGGLSFDSRSSNAGPGTVGPAGPAATRETTLSAV